MSQPIPKAGCIAYRRKNNATEIVLLYRENFQDWTFPKGHIDPGETAEIAAIRELKEETGLKGQLMKPLVPNEYEVKGDWVKEPTFAIVYMFLVEVIGGDFAERTESKEHPEWVPLDEVRERLSYPNLKEYFDLILPELTTTNS